MCPHSFLGVHVDVGPEPVVSADGHQREIEWAVLRTDVGKAAGVAGVAAEVGTVVRTGEDPGRPESRVTGEESPGKVPGRSAHQIQIVDGTALPPIQFDDSPGRDAPLTQVSSDTEGHEERRTLSASEGKHRVEVEMVVV